MKLNEYQTAAHATAKSDDIELFTLGLFGEAGSVASSIKKLKRENAAEAIVRDEIATELGDVLWYLAEIATHYDLKLSEIATANLEKTKYLFDGFKGEFDAAAPEAQRLPSVATIDFDDRGQKTSIKVGGVSFGDPLDDNSHDDDGYRFHDVFHLAYMTHLGWSPVIRSLLKRKRKYDEDIDRVEDGARSIFLEEGISVFVFNQNARTAEGVSSFADRRNVPFSVLSAIKMMTKKLEVGRRDVSDWRNAIADGFRIFDQLHQNGGGQVICDRNRKRMTFRAHTAEG